MAHRQISGEMRECVTNCQDCGALCLETISHCLELGGRHAEARHIKTLAQCAEICRTSAAFMLLGSDTHSRTCALCAEICRACAESCEQFGDDPLMKRCAGLCRRCAESCDRMAGTATRRAG